jgi:antirestriction protein ArdC
MTKSAKLIHHNPKTATVYSGQNLVRLEESHKEKGFKSASWLTFTQITDLGGRLVPGSKGTGLVMFPNGTMKWFRVFNIDQTEGLPEEILKAKPSAKKKPSKKASTKKKASKKPSTNDLEKIIAAQVKAAVAAALEELTK